MSLKQAPTAAGSARQLPQHQGDTQLRGGWLILARAAWGTGVALVLGLFLASLPAYVTHLQTICLRQPCSYLQLTPSGVHALHDLGISIAGYAALTLAFTLGSALVWMVMGGLLVWRRSDDWMALLVAFLLVVGGASNGINVGASPSQVGWQVQANLLGFLNGLAIVAVLALFPNGRFVPRSCCWVIPAFLLASVPHQFFPDWEARLPGWASVLGLLDFVGALCLLLLAQLYRYWRVSTSLQRQQTKWILFSLGAGVVVFLGWGLLQRFVPALNGSLSDPANAYLNDVGSLLFPIAFAVAILRYRLWDIDAIINRTLVYGALTACVVGIYIVVVGYLGAVFRTGSNLIVSLVATGLVAVIFQPLRGWLQGNVNRLLYGQRDEPYAVVTQLGQRLESTLAPDAVLPAIAETVAKALKLPYVAIALKHGGESAIVAAYGGPVEGTLTVPLVFHAEPIGTMVLGPRRRGEAFTSADRRLLDNLARQAGLAAHAVRLTMDLQQSRERLVAAREEERRRLRRDLHDGLGATLAALLLQSGALRAKMRRDLPAADAEVLELQAALRAAIADIRRLVYGLRPPSLDEFGLVGAIREDAARYEALHEPAENAPAGAPDGRLRVMVETPEHLPPLPAAVEVAAYRVAQEALTNVVRHAHAEVCHVRLALGDDSGYGLTVEVADNGVGLPPAPQAGVGLLSMRERAEELGGTCAIESAPGQGTRVLVRLPLQED